MCTSHSEWLFTIVWEYEPEVGSYEFAEQSLLSNYEGYNYIFAKDMAFYIPNEIF